MENKLHISQFSELRGLFRPIIDLLADFKVPILFLIVKHIVKKPHSTVATVW